MATQQESMLYFAYGSNMHLKQMAQRCPSSRLAGTAILRGYRWQINQRGVANVVPCPDQSVEGVVFRVSDKDRRHLDRFEGYGKFYDRQELTVEVLPVKSGIESKKLHALSKRFEQGQDLDLITKEYENEERLRLKNLEEAAEIEEALLIDANKPQPPPPRQQTSQSGPVENPNLHQLHGSRPFHSTTDDNSNHRSANSRNVIINTKALVYLSTNYTEDGEIREEYVERMRNAISDAVKAGVSLKFLQQNLDPLVFRNSEQHICVRHEVERSSDQSRSDPKIGFSQPSTSSSSRKQDIRRTQSARTRTTTSTNHTRSLDTGLGQSDSGSHQRRRRKRTRSNSLGTPAIARNQQTWLETISSYIFMKSPDTPSRSSR